MQKQEAGKSNRELAALRITWANSKNRKHRKSLIALADRGLSFDCSECTGDQQQQASASPPAQPSWLR